MSKNLTEREMAIAIGNGISCGLLPQTTPVPTPLRGARTNTNRGPIKRSLQPEPTHREFFSIPELAERWRCSRGTVYNRLRKAGTKVMDWSGSGEKGKKAVRASDVYEIENRRMKRLA